MIKIVVVSDSHGNPKAIDKVFNTVKFDYLIFLGDGLSDLGCYANLENVLKVRGNCDFFSRTDDYLIKQLGGLKFFCCHGDAYGVKRGTQKIVSAGKLLNADVVIFGHTHKFSYDIVEGMHVINCPSLNDSRGQEGQYLTLEVEDKKIFVNKHKI